MDEAWITAGKQKQDRSRVSGSDQEDRACSQRRVPRLQDKKRRRRRIKFAFAFSGPEIEALNLESKGFLLGC